MSEQPILVWDFETECGLGTDLTVWTGNGGVVTIVQPAPCYLEASTAASRGQANVNHTWTATEEEGEEAVRVVLDVEFPVLPPPAPPDNRYNLSEILRVSNSGNYGPGSRPHIMTLTVNTRETGVPGVFDVYWRLFYRDEDSVPYIIFPNMQIEAGRRYRIEAYVSVGFAGQIIISVDGAEIFSVNNINNNGQLINSVDIGLPNADPNTVINDYRLEIFSVPVVLYTVSGYVRDGETMFPLVGAGVLSNGTGTQTDANGYFEFNLPAATYTLQATKFGYQLGVMEVTVTQNTSVEFRLSPMIGGGYWPIRSATVLHHWFAYSDDAFLTCLRELSRIFHQRVNFVDLRVYWSIGDSQAEAVPRNVNNMFLLDHFGRTNLEELRTAIRRAHQHGFGVILGIIASSNLIGDETMTWWQSPDGGNRPTVTLGELIDEMGDWDTWWTNYTAFCQMIIDLAIAEGVEVVHIGWEYIFLDPRFEDNTFGGRWTTLIDTMRQSYSGLIAYEANYPYTQAGVQALLANTWFSSLDYLDISTYPSLIVPQYPRPPEYNPTLNELIAGWTDNPVYTEVTNFIEIYRQIAEAFGIRILINLGYGSYDGTCATPWRPMVLCGLRDTEETCTQFGCIWENGTCHSPPPDWEEQAMCWDAFFQAWKDADFLIGCHMEHFDNIATADDITSGFRGKDAQYAIASGLRDVSPHVPTGCFSCFIATAAYGSPLAPQISVLKWLRNHCLPDVITRVYYRLSPQFADVIRKHGKLRTATQICLKPIIAIVKALRNVGT